MRKIITLLCCSVLALTLAGCGEKKWSDAEIKEQMKDAGYSFLCNRDASLNYCSFSGNDGYLIMYQESTGLQIMHSKSLTLYDIKNDTILSGTGKSADMKKAYNQIIDSADITSTQLLNLMKKEWKAYKK